MYFKAVLYWLDRLDRILLQALNSGLANPVFDLIMPIITNRNIWLGPLIIAWMILFYKGGRRGRIAAVILLVSVIASDLIAAQIIKPLAGRLRPGYAMPDSIRLLAGKGGKFGFVSNHSANSFAAAVVVGYFYPRLKITFIALAFTVAFSRVYVGVHYPGDVLAGAFFGYTLAWGMLSLWALLKLRELKRGRTWVWYHPGSHPPFIQE